jgi:hypothetical protein
VKSYRVPVIITDVYHVTVEAEDLDKAHAKVDAMSSDQIIEDSEFQTCDVETLIDKADDLL